MKLRAENLGFSYTNVRVFSGISCTVDPGTLVAVTGTNGAGKSTFIKCLNHILEPDGQVLLDGVDLRTLSRKQIARRLAYLPQKNVNTFPISVFDAVLTGRFPHRRWCRKHAEDLAKVSDVLERLNLSPLAFRDFDELSGGQQQKVLLARALVQEADILLLDEPVSSLDIRHQIEVMEVVKSFVRKYRKSVIIAIHDLNLASRYVDRVLMLHDGGIYREGTPEAVFTPDVIAHVFGVTARVFKDDGRLTIIPLEPIPSEYE